MLKLRRACFIVPQIGFNDVELTTIRDKLLKNRFLCDIASYAKGDVISKTGLKMKADKLIPKVKSEDYDCFIFVGGENVTSLAEYDIVVDLVKKAYKEGRILAILCVNPVLLLRKTKTDLLKGRRVTVFATKNGWSRQAVVDENGILVDEPVVVDENIITCRDEKDALLLAETIIAEFRKRWLSKKFAD